MRDRTRARLPTTTLERARDLRRSSTDAERRLWHRLRGGQLDGLKFRRQHPVPPYVIDFYCESAGLVVEIDGSQHTPESDQRRTAYLTSLGLRVLRFGSQDAVAQTEAVVEAIWKAAREPPLTPTPLPEGEGPQVPPSST